MVFSVFAGQPAVSHLYKTPTAATHSFANFFMTKWSWTGKFYVLISNTICKLFMQFWISIKNSKADESRLFCSKCKKIIAKQMLSLACEQVIVICITE